MSFLTFLMTLDHVNKDLLNPHVAAVFDVGRSVMPIFAIVLAYMARPGALDRAFYLRFMKRLAIAGMLATPPFIALSGRLWLACAAIFLSDAVR